MYVENVETYRGIRISQYTEMRWGYRFSIYPIACAAGKEDHVGGAGAWSADTLEEAHAEIDRFFMVWGVSELPSPRRWAPPAGSDELSLTAAALKARIRTMDDAQQLANAIQAVTPQVFLGIPLMSWRVDSVPGCIRFGRFSDAGELQAQIAVINAPESRRAEFIPTNLPVPTEAVFLG